MNVDLDSILAPNEKCPVREVGTGLVIMAQEGTATHSLEDIGAFIWKQFDGKRSLRVIAGTIAAEYDVSADQAANDLQGFVLQLLESDLVLAV